MVSEKAKDLKHLRDGSEISIITIKDSIEGFTAAWLANRILVRQNNLKVRWFALDPKQPFPDIREKVRGSHLRLIGLGCGRDILNYLAKEAQSIILYDNDFETKNRVGGLRFVKVELKKSPARMFWNELKTTLQIKAETTTQPAKPGEKPKKVLNTVHFESAPWIVDFTEKRDAWPWSGINPTLVTRAIRDFKQDFDKWDDLALRDLGDMERLGKEILSKPAQAKEQLNNKPEGKHDKRPRRKTRVSSGQGATGAQAAKQPA